MLYGDQSVYHRFGMPGLVCHYRNNINNSNYSRQWQFYGRFCSLAQLCRWWMTNLYFQSYTSHRWSISVISVISFSSRRNDASSVIVSCVWYCLSHPSLVGQTITSGDVLIHWGNSLSPPSSPTKCSTRQNTATPTLNSLESSITQQRKNSPPFSDTFAEVESLRAVPDRDPSET